MAAVDIAFSAQESGALCPFEVLHRLTGADGTQPPLRFGQAQPTDDIAALGRAAPGLAAQ
jgi:hypothetical protein